MCLKNQLKSFEFIENHLESFKLCGDNTINMQRSLSFFVGSAIVSWSLLGKVLVNFEYTILILHNRGHASVVSFTYLMGKETQRPYRKLKHKVRLFGGGNDRVNLVFNALLGTSK